MASGKPTGRAGEANPAPAGPQSLQASIASVRTPDKTALTLKRDLARLVPEPAQIAALQEAGWHGPIISRLHAIGLIAFLRRRGAG